LEDWGIETPSTQTNELSTKNRSRHCYQMYFYALLIFMATAAQRICGHLISELGNCPGPHGEGDYSDPLGSGNSFTRGYLKLNKLLRLRRYCIAYPNACRRFVPLVSAVFRDIPEPFSRWQARAGIKCAVK